MKPIVAIVGRPNVGKSTLFNRLTNTRTAIIEDEPGVTRDRLYRDVDWSGKSFTLVDTGGLSFDDKDLILREVKHQVEIAIHEAALILFVVDRTSGISHEDEAVAQLLRRSDKPVIVVVNKVNQFNDLSDIYEFYHLGLDPLIPISAIDGKNTGDLLDQVVALLDEIPTETMDDNDAVRIAVVGRPNVGKSSLCNAIIGEDRSIVSDLAGTTRDAIDSYFRYHGEDYVIVDTAGMRKRSKITNATERYSVVRALRTVERSDVVLMVIDASEGMIEQDKKIVGYAHEQGKGIIIIVNKWDLVEKDTNTLRHMEKKIRQELLFLAYAPIIFVSALTGTRLSSIMAQVKSVSETRLQRVPTSLLNDIIRDAVYQKPPPTSKGKHLRLYYATQVGVAPPTFVLFVNDKTIMHFSYLRYLENRIRDCFAFEGTSIRIFMKNRKED